MAKYKVAYGLFKTKLPDGTRIYAHRGEIVDVPEDVAKDHGEFLRSVDEELSIPGTLVALNENAQDEHISNYLNSGNVSEILDQSAAYTPTLVERLLVAESAGTNRKGLIEGFEKQLGKGEKLEVKTDKSKK